MLEFIVVLRFLATCLITNSHFDAIYPIAALATGGVPGNSIFFFCSGYCLSKTDQKFFKWIIAKIKKLYIPLFIVLAVCCILGFYEINTASEFRKLFVFPTRYWFFPAILFGFIYMYSVTRLQENRRILVMAAAILVMLVRYYLADVSATGVEGDLLSRTLIYTIIMQIGYYCRQHIEKIEASDWLCGIWVLGGVAGIYAWKYLENIFLFAYYTKYIEYVFLCLFAFSSFSICMKHESDFKRMSKWGGGKPSGGFLSEHGKFIWFRYSLFTSCH